MYTLNIAKMINLPFVYISFMAYKTSLMGTNKEFYHFWACLKLNFTLNCILCVLLTKYVWVNRILTSPIYMYNFKLYFLYYRLDGAGSRLQIDINLDPYAVQKRNSINALPQKTREQNSLTSTTPTTTSFTINCN